MGRARRLETERLLELIALALPFPRGQAIRALDLGFAAPAMWAELSD